MSQRPALRMVTSQLKNGLQLVVFPEAGARGQVSLGVFSKAGCRYELPSLKHTSYLLTHSAAVPTEHYNVAEKLQAIDNLTGGHYKIDTHREVMYHALQCPKWKLSEAMHFLASCALCPGLSDESMELARAHAHSNMMLKAHQPDQLCFEWVHQQAFGGKGLGLPQHPEVANSLNYVTSDMIKTFISALWQPSRMTVVCSGVEMEELEVLAEGLYGKLENTDVFDADGKLIGEYVPSEYVGGHFYNESLVQAAGTQFFEERHLSHIVYCYKGLPQNHVDHSALMVLWSMLGGGASFSAGGPGKGLYSKLNLEVIRKHEWVDCLDSVVSYYSDGGLFGLYGACGHDHVLSLLSVLVKQMGELDLRHTELALERAKNAYFSTMWLTWEEGLPFIEDVGKQWSIYGKHFTPEEYKEGIQRVTMNDIRRVVVDIMEGGPSLVIRGDVRQMPHFAKLEDLVEKLATKKRQQMAEILK